MKKLYTMLFAAAAVLSVNAQEDLSVSLQNFTNGQATSNDPLDLSFTITNEGIDIPAGDTIYYAVSIGTDVWTVDDLTSGYVSGSITGAVFPNGASTDVTVVGIDMAWAYANLGGLNGDICITILGVNDEALSAVTDINPLDNIACVDYTVTQVAGLEGVGMDHISVYPNPATEIVNFQVGNNEVSHINVFDMNGRLVSSMQVIGNVETLDTENIQNGIYYYQMMNGEEMVATDKFVVSK
ncbi:MAG: T9SS type A sorting domain-containing protein [Crocinitomicaceae bacterium]|nr:T9SS type A sorting domain-containing protein [Crocinitomicaceae bacterium]